jgi:hypothetical protein
VTSSQEAIMETLTTRETRAFAEQRLHGLAGGVSRADGRPTHGAAISRRVLQRENGRFRGTGGFSGENRALGFRPAFLDTRTQTVYLSRFANGELAPFHLLDGLPEELVLHRDASGRALAARATLVSGFVFDGCFYDREAAARKVAEAA